MVLLLMAKHDKTRPARIVDFVESWWSQHGYGPSVRDIGQGCAINSLSVVKYNLDNLRIQGRVAFDDNVARSIRVVRG